MLPRRAAGLAVITLLSAGGLSPVGASERPIRFERLSLEDGLSQTTVVAIHQDSRGYLWFGTEDGLNRYDGVRFTVYKNDPADPRSLPHDAVLAIDEDAAGNLWVGTEGGGVAMLDRASDRFLRYRHDPDAPEGLASDYVRALHVDSRGRIWIGTRESGIDRLDPSSGRFTHFGHVPGDPATLGDDRIYALLEDRDSVLWVATNGGLSRVDPETGEWRRFRHDPADPASLSDDRVRAIFEDRGGTLWVGTLGGGLDRLDRDAGAFVHFRHDPEDPTSLSHDRVRAILEDQAGRLWIGTSGGLNLMDDSGRFARYGHDPANPTSLGDDHVMSVFQDRGGVLWIGTRSAGVSKWNPLTWQFGHYGGLLSGAQELSSKNVTGFAEDRAGNLYVGSFGGGVDVINPISGSVTGYRHDSEDRSSLTSDRVTTLRHDHRGALWIATLDGGLNRLDPASGALTAFRHDPEQPGSLAADGIMELFEDSRGRLWVGTFGGGLDRFEPSTGTFTHYRYDPEVPSSLSGNRVTSLAEAADGSLWVGTDGAGLNLLDPRRGRFRRFAHDPDDPRSLPADTIFSLHVDPSGTLWIGTRGGGLSRLEAVPDPQEPALFRNYSERDGLPNEVVYGVLSDSAGHIWLSTNRGLSRFDPRTERFRNFNAAHGLQADEFNFNAYFASSSGKLFFGGVNGFNAFFPERLRRNENVPPVVLTSLLKFNEPASDLGPTDRIDRIELGFREDVVTFEFAALDFTSPEGNRYAYLLEGFDRTWTDLGSINRVTYTNLDAGDYVFRVRAANNDGVWNQDGLEIAVSVLSPPWATPWAYAGYSLAVLGVCFGFFQMQQRKLRREAEYSRRLESQVRERTAELATRNSELEELNDKLTEASLTDSLTGLANRRFLFEYIEKEVTLVHRKYRHIMEDTLGPAAFDLAFVMVDLDDFKMVNDTFGHATGDLVLKQVRKILEASSRSSDILIRWGGDEFLIVARELDPEGLDSLAERIRSKVESHPFVLGDGRVIRTTCSVGFASYPFIRSDVDAISWENVINVADCAMYLAKRSGRNAWVGFAGTPETSAAGLLTTIRETPDRLEERGMLEVRTSIADRGDLAWREKREPRQAGRATSAAVAEARAE